jgi:FkbM family methyltransferase
MLTFAGLSIRKYRHQLIFLLSIVGIISYFASVLIMSRVYLVEHMVTTTAESFSAVRLVDPSNYSPNGMMSEADNFSCVTTSVADLKFPICTYKSSEDQFVSDAILAGNYFEGNEVSTFVSLLRRNPGIQFVDIGANIGIFTLPAARITEVIAVEPYWRSMRRLARSVELGGVGSKIRLVQNAISRARVTFRLGLLKSNQGGTFLMDAAAAAAGDDHQHNVSCGSSLEGVPCSSGPTIDAILLNDLLPLMAPITTDVTGGRHAMRSVVMKVDVEGREVDVFTEDTAGEFFNIINVPVVYMEWFLCKKRPEVGGLLDFFYSRNYTAFANSAMHEQLTRSNYNDWHANIIFRKAGFQL